MGAVAKSARADNVRLNQLRAKQQAAERRRRLTIAIAATAAVVVVVAVLVGVALFGPKQQAVATGPLDPAVYTTLSTVPVATFDQVGAGVGVSNPPEGDLGPGTHDGRQARGALRRRRVLPVLRGGALAVRGGDDAVRPVREPPGDRERGGPRGLSEHRRR